VRAKQLTEEVAVSSQIPFRKGRDREDLDPVHPVSFYGRRRSSTPPPVAIEPPRAVPQPQVNRNRDMLPPPRPMAALPHTNAATLMSRHHASAVATTNPYLAPPPGPSRVGIGHTARGLALNVANGNAAGVAQGPRPVQKAPRSTTILERSEPPAKKSKVADANPYAASPSSTSTSMITFDFTLLPSLIWIVPQFIRLPLVASDLSMVSRRLS
jgi:hypothetical protein